MEINVKKDCFYIIILSFLLFFLVGCDSGDSETTADNNPEDDNTCIINADCNQGYICKANTCILEEESEGFTAHYYTTWKTPYIHFNDGSVDSETWTEVPGKPMEADSLENWFVYTHTAEWNGYVKFVFNEGTISGNCIDEETNEPKLCWDNPSDDIMQNYETGYTEFWVKDGKIYKSFASVPD